ncbi:hypothetical protein BDY17DRAFT_202577 [Neohortaea acidophila]|uniref:Uncharacterized protein n=1 Tax=Neohortaea acidophila TaxID=245834 RepID=A0A6A6PM84_9PEZI|nr:uncharacterized protein BDY17DRAFT_202577 [Neohortaea acidophila]KAF2480926.1 hypothetical protein BDY17DRAFT_202577 [Neohortaea acidophila]
MKVHFTFKSPSSPDTSKSSNRVTQAHFSEFRLHREFTARFHDARLAYYLATSKLPFSIYSLALTTSLYTHTSMVRSQSLISAGDGAADSKPINNDATNTKTTGANMNHSKAIATKITQTAMNDSTATNSEAPTIKSADTTSNITSTHVNAIESTMSESKNPGNEGPDGKHDNSMAVDSTDIAIAPLERIQRALGLKHLSNPEDGVACEVESPFDHRRVSRFLFERNVIFVAIHLQLRKNDTGGLTKISLGVARLDTEDLDRMSPGRCGENFEEEITIDSFVEEPLFDRQVVSDYQIGKMRRSIANSFENTGPSHCGKAIAMVKAKREIVLVTDGTAELDHDLSLLGFNPRHHVGVIDIVDLRTLLEAVKAWHADHHGGYSDFDVHEGGQIRIPTKVKRVTAALECRTAVWKTLFAMINLAITDIQTCDAWETRRDGNGGPFPGPFRKTETESEKLASELERILGLALPDPGQDIRQCVQALLEDRIITRVGTAVRTEHRHHQEECEIPATAETTKPSRAAASPTRANVTEVGQEQHTTPKVPDLTSVQPIHTAESGDVTTVTQIEQKPQSNLDVAKDTTRRDKPTNEHSAAVEASVPASKGFEEKSKQSSVEPVRNTSPPTKTAPCIVNGPRTPQPSHIGSALFTYHRHEEDFCEQVKEAVRSFSPDIDEYYITERYECQTGEVKVRDKIWPPENYIKLARRLVEHPSSISLGMVAELLRDTVQREMVDGWFTSLPLNDPQRDEDQIAKHQRFRVILRKTYELLCGPLSRRVPDLAQRMEKVTTEAKVRRG